MQASSDQEPGGSDALKRYGPIAAIVVVIAVVAALVLSGGGGDDDDDVGATDSTAVTDDDGPDEADPGDEDPGDDEGNETPSVPEGAISYAQAEELGILDQVTFMDTCDTELGRVALPWFFAPECYANADDNGGDTHRGVTGDTITVVYYNAPDVDPTLDFITGPINNDDTAAQIAETMQNYNEMFNALFQTYGRTVDLQILNASGTSEDETAAIADAQRAVEEFGAFAVIGGPALATDAWVRAITDQGVICICGARSQQFHDNAAPYAYSVTQNQSQTNIHSVEYVVKKLAGKEAVHAGDEAFHSQERTLGLLYITSGEESEIANDEYEALLNDNGVELTERVSYDLSQLLTSPEIATNAIAKFKAAGVTTILLRGDPVGPSNFTQEATAQEYFPEWVVTGGTLVDTTVFGRVYDQAQWANAFGITTGAVDTTPTLAAAYSLHEWYFGSPPPADETANVLIPGISLFFNGVQTAGPNLNPETFRDGFFSGEPTANAITEPSLSYGDHGLWDALGTPTGCNTDSPSGCDWNGIDDFTEFWWDADEVGPDELNREAPGMLRFVDGGTRYYPGEWNEELRVFEEEGSVTIFEVPPAEEAPPEYPSPNN